MVVTSRPVAEATGTTQHGASAPSGRQLPKNTKDVKFVHSTQRALAGAARRAVELRVWIVREGLESFDSSRTALPLDASRRENAQPRCMPVNFLPARLRGNDDARAGKIIAQRAGRPDENTARLLTIDSHAGDWSW